MSAGLRFDLIFMLRDKDDYEKDSKLCEHILSLHAVRLCPKCCASLGPCISQGGLWASPRDIPFQAYATAVKAITIAVHSNRHYFSCECPNGWGLGTSSIATVICCSQLKQPFVCPVVISHFAPSFAWCCRDAQHLLNRRKGKSSRLTC